MKRDRVKTAVVVDLTSSSVDVKYDVDRRSTVKDLLELFSAHPRREYAAALLQRLNDMDPDQRRRELRDGEATLIVESAAYLVVATDP